MPSRSSPPPPGRPRARRWLALLSALVCASCSGGGPTLNPVHGKVLYKNQPLKGAQVTFHPRGPTDINTIRPVGLTGEDGTFSVKTGQKEGAPAGPYVVTLICSEEIKPKAKKLSMESPGTRDMLGGTYARQETSKIHVEIKSGVNQLEPFNLN
jgi:hypothetical protein